MKNRIPSILDIFQDAAPTSRRSFLKRTAVMGVSIPVVGTLLAACGGDDDDDDGGSEETATEADSGSTEESTEASTEEASTEEEDSATEEESTDEESSDSGESSEGEPKQGGTLVLMGHHEISSLSPDDAGPDVHWVMVTQIHNAMVELDPWFEFQPTLCESWEASEDGLQYTFALREGVKFHDGEEFTAADVKYTFEYYGSPDNAAITASDYNGITYPLETPDDYTAIINLEAPNAAFIARAGQSFIVPEHHHSEVGEAGYKSDPIGTGPFMLSEYEPASHAVVERFDDHFRGAANLDAVRENIVPEPSVRAVALETGEADSSVWSLLTEDNIRLRDSGDFTVYATSGTSCNHFPMNNTRPQFQDKVVRQAMMHAIDRDNIVDDLWKGLAVKATANLSPALEFYYEPDVMQYEFDPEKAMQMLDEAGWVAGDGGIREKDGVKLSWTCAVIAGDQARRPEAEVVQQWFKDIGLDMQIEDTTSASSGMRDGEHDMSLYNWTYGGSSGDPDPSATLRSDSLNNFSHYANPKVDELIDQGLQETDPEARKEIYSELQKIVAEDVPFLYIQFWDWFNFFGTRVKGLPETILTSNLYKNAYLWWIDED